jgi:DNA-binding NarL/FixJ family response regulator
VVAVVVFAWAAMLLAVALLLDELLPPHPLATSASANAADAHRGTGPTRKVLISKVPLSCEAKGPSPAMAAKLRFIGWDARAAAFLPGSLGSSRRTSPTTTTILLWQTVKDPGTQMRANTLEKQDPARPIRVVTAEDSYVVREFLTTMLEAAPEVELVAVCSNRNELDDAIASLHPDVLITDIRMPPSGGEEGISVAARLRECDPHVGVVVLSQYAEPEYALALLEGGSGRRAYLLKERIRNREDLISAIQTVARGGSVIDPKIVDVLIMARSRVNRSPLADLTPRELELLGEIATGKSNGAIAESLVLTKRAVEKHVNSIFLKLGLPEDQDVSRRVKATLIYLAEADV